MGRWLNGMFGWLVGWNGDSEKNRVGLASGGGGQRSFSINAHKIYYLRFKAGISDRD